MSTLDFIMAYEGGELESDEQIIAGFQALKDEGLLFKLQGHYGRMGSQLIEMGLIK